MLTFALLCGKITENIKKNACAIMDISSLKNMFSLEGFSLTESEASRFMKYTEMLIAGNSNINLTAITEPERIVSSHFIDSLLPLKADVIGESAKCCDVGSGAGFPGIPLAIMRPDITMVLIEPILKRTDFLNSVIGELGLRNVSVCRSRVEDAADLKGYFDVALSRAVSKLSVLCEYCIPLLSVGGTMVALKSRLAEEELKDSENAITVLGGKFVRIYGSEERNLVIIDKTADTPSKYPRRAGIPLKRPL